MTVHRNSGTARSNQVNGSPLTVKLLVGDGGRSSDDKT